LLQGSTGCDRNGSTGPQAPQIHTPEARDLFQNQSVFVDVRSKQDFDKGRIAGAINVPLNEVEVRLKTLPKDRIIVLYESGRASGEDSCAASKAAAGVLLARGFQKVKVYKEGLAAWEKEGLPVQH
jgi:rhodanese-related sulfurtransferase